MNLALGLGQHLGPSNERRSCRRGPGCRDRSWRTGSRRSSARPALPCVLVAADWLERQPDGVGPRVVVGAVAGNVLEWRAVAQVAVQGGLRPGHLREPPWPSWTSTAVSWRPRIKDLAVKALADPVVARPMTILGVDAIPAISIVAAVGDFSRFGDAEKVTMRKPASWQRTPWPGAAASRATTTPTPLRRRATSLLG